MIFIFRKQVTNFIICSSSNGNFVLSHVYRESYVMGEIIDVEFSDRISVFKFTESQKVIFGMISVYVWTGFDQIFALALEYSNSVAVGSQQ